jgi:hypothetical protein
VECQPYFTQKSLLISICKELRVEPRKTIFEMATQVGRELALSGRPLLLDEMDHLVNRGLIELVRSLHSISNAAIFMIGEEEFPAKLTRWGRFKDRVLDWCPAERSDLSDATKLAKLYSPDIDFDPELLAAIVGKSEGIARKICVNIERERQHARASGAKTASLKLRGDRPFYTGEAPPKRIYGA